MPMTAQRKNTQSAGIPAPVRGIVASGVYTGTGAAIAENAVGGDSAIWLYNMIAGEYGCRVRPGSREFATNIPSQVGFDAVRTVMFYNSVVAGGAGGIDSTFAVTDAGIYDVSAGGAGPWDFVPATSLVWPSQGGDAGWCSYLNYTNVAGDHFLLVCDEQNGYYIFDGTTWAPGNFTGTPKPLPADLVQIVEWNARVWFVEKNTARAWFLDPLALEGGIESMDVGSRFKEGGHLVQCSTWTHDDGSGMDDKFVMISSAGDVLVWNGTDPTTAADLTLLGRWAVGTVPEGRRVMSDWGGDVLILTSTGLLTLSALMRGIATLNPGEHLSHNINQYLRQEMQKSINEYGWAAELYPAQGIAVFSVPQPPSSTRAPIQFVLATATGSWSMFRDLDMVSMTQVNAGFAFGTNNGRVMLFEGTVDEATLAGDSAQGIAFSMLTHYSGIGNPAAWKRMQFIRPYWIGDGLPAYNVQTRYDFDLSEIYTSPDPSGSDISTWDGAVWDEDVWAGTAQSYLETVGLRGMGRHVAIALRGIATNELTYIGADVMYDTGGDL